MFKKAKGNGEISKVIICTTALGFKTNSNVQNAFLYCMCGVFLEKYLNRKYNQFVESKNEMNAVKKRMD